MSNEQIRLESNEEKIAKLKSEFPKFIDMDDKITQDNTNRGGVERKVSESEVAKHEQDKARIEKSLLELAQQGVDINSLGINITYNFPDLMTNIEKLKFLKEKDKNLNEYNETDYFVEKNPPRSLVDENKIAAIKKELEDSAA
jgi:hypothetical protein